MVTVGGSKSPSLTLNDGGMATYVTGSGSTALIFSYLVAPGQNTSDLTVKGLSLNGATIQDLAGNNAVLTGAVTNPAGILQIDTIPPKVTKVTTSPTSGGVTTGRAATISLAMSEKVIVSGAPTLVDLAGNSANLPGGEADTKLSINTTGTSTGPSGGNFGQGSLLDLMDIAFGSNTTLGYAANSGNTGGTLSDGTHTANIALLGQYMAGSFVTSADGFGGIIHDPPPAIQAQTLTQPHHS